MSKQIDITKKFYLNYHNLLSNKNESQFVTELNDITTNYSLASFVDIPNIKTLIFNLEEEKILFSYKMSLLTYVKSDLSNEEAFELDLL